MNVTNLRILILSPALFPEIAGNAITAERWHSSLSAAGMRVAMACSKGMRPTTLAEQLSRFRPDIVHAHHVYKAGALLLDPRVAPHLPPVVVSPGGTDLNIDLEMEDRERIVTQALGMARAIVVQSAETARRIAVQFPALAGRIAFAPKAVFWFGEDSYALRKALACAGGDILFFLPAGVRPVKGNLECLEGMRRLHRVRPTVRFAAAGPAIDPGYASRFSERIGELSSFARWIEVVPPQAMHSAYREADVVLNASFSEGLSNSVIEGIAAGRPILASDIPGNREPVLGSGAAPAAGVLFDPHDPDDFTRKAMSLVDNEGLRGKLADAALRRSAELPSAEDEAAALIAAYQAALNGP